MSKKIKVFIIVIAVVIVLGIAAIPLLKWYNNQEHVIVSKSFDVSISKNADLIYFDEDDTYIHAAYGVDDQNYNNIFERLQKIGYKTTQIDLAKEYEWIPTDKIIAAYEVKNGAKVFITKANDGGITELYFVK